jgi:hypothetical protein
MRELSLLRTQMKRDVGVLGVDTQLSPEDKDFLERAGVGQRRVGIGRRGLGWH